MNQPSVFLKSTLFIGVLFLLVRPELARAQNICDKPDLANPCLDQPHENDTQIKGKLSVDNKGQPVNGAVVQIEVGGKPQGTAQVNPDGRFAFSGLKALVPGTPVQADQIAPPPPPGAAVPSSGAVIVAPSNNICTKPLRPCLNQPTEDDVNVTGQLTLATADGKPTPPPAGSAVDIKVNGKSVGSAQVISSDGSFEFKGLPIKLSQYVTVQADQIAPPPDKGQSAPSTGPVPVVALPVKTGDTSSKYTLGLVGINVTGTSSSGPSQQYFASFDLIAPLKWLGPGCGKDGDKDSDNPIERRCWVWINPRIANLPSAATTALSSINSASLTTAAGGQTIGQMTQSVEVQAGVEYYIFKPGISPNNGQYWGLGKSWAQSTVSLIAGAGLVTPFNSISAAPEFGLNNNLGQQFNQQPTLASTYPQLAQALCSYGYSPAAGAPTCPSPLPTAKPTIAAFVFPNRSRLYRDWFTGLRLRFWYFNGDCSSNSKSNSCSPVDVYPGTLDLRFGQDETVTGGILAKTVMTLTGSFPLPGTQGIIRVFGSAYMKLTTNQNTIALVAVPVTSFTTLDNANVVVQQVARSDQDYYRLGIGVDLVAALAKVFKSTTLAAANTAAPAAGTTAAGN